MNWVWCILTIAVALSATAAVDAWWNRHDAIPALDVIDDDPPYWTTYDGLYDDLLEDQPCRGCFINFTGDDKVLVFPQLTEDFWFCIDCAVMT